jgi:alpha-L-rhamnosidase
VSGGGGPAWSGIVVTLPWEVYRTFGDTALLEQMFPVMERQLSFYTNKTRADGLLHAWDSSQWDFLGDWITPHGSESNVTSPENILFNNCYLVYITDLTAKIAEVLGYAEKAEKYAAAAEAYASAVNRAFYSNTTGGYVDLLQTHLVMPLATGSVPPSRREATMALLEQAIDTTGGHLDTGLTANYFMTKLFTETGRNDLMVQITNKTTFPSYGYFLEQGYTTWPESWKVEKCCSDSSSKMQCVTLAPRVPVCLWTGSPICFVKPHTCPLCLAA